MSQVIETTLSQKVTELGTTISAFDFKGYGQIVQAINTTSIMTINNMANGTARSYDAENFQFQTFSGFAGESADLIEIRHADTEVGLATAEPTQVKGRFLIENGLGKAWVQVKNAGIDGNSVRIAFHGNMVL